MRDRSSRRALPDRSLPSWGRCLPPTEASCVASVPDRGRSGRTLAALVVRGVPFAAFGFGWTDLPVCQAAVGRRARALRGRTAVGLPQRVTGDVTARIGDMSKASSTPAQRLHRAIAPAGPSGRTKYLENASES